MVGQSATAGNDVKLEAKSTSLRWYRLFSPEKDYKQKVVTQSCEFNAHSHM